MEKLKLTATSRKFWLTALVSALAIALFWTSHIDIDRMLEIIRWAAGIYVGSLSIEDAAKQLLPIIKTMTNEAG